MTAIPTSPRSRLIAVIRPFRLDTVLEQLLPVHPRDVVVEQVRGYGRQKDHLELYADAEVEALFLPKARIELTVETAQVDQALAAIREGARTGRIGDGKVFVHPVQADRDPGAPV